MTADTNRGNLEKTVEALRGFTIDCSVNTEEKGIIYGTGVWNVGEIRGYSCLW